MSNLPLQMMDYVSGEVQKAVLPDHCKRCGEKQYSIADKNYLKLFGICWSCDKKKWEAGILSLEEFEKREEQAAQANL